MDYDRPFGTGGEAIATQSMHNMSLKTRLDKAVSDCEERLKEAQEARDILSRNPDLERLLNIMQKGRF